MQARKQIQNWLVWLAADAIYIPLYFVKALPLTGVLYSVFALMCVKGWRDWKRTRAAQAGRRWKHGAVIGKFLPFHTGHRHLIETALSRAEKVTVIVVSRAGEPIPGAVRRRWIEEALPEVEVKLLDQDEVGLASDDTAGWAAATIGALGGEPDVVFTSERYGHAWAKAMGCDHVLVDRRRRTVPISSTRIRRDPLGNLEYLRGGARGHYVKRVCLLGAESTGKTTLARALADHYGTVWNPEFGHMYSWFRDEARRLAHLALRRVHVDREAPELVRGLPCRPREPRALLRHERVDDRASSTRSTSARARRRSTRSQGGATTCTILCDPRRRFARTSSACAPTGPTAPDARGVSRPPRRIGARFVEVSGTHAERMRAATAAVDELSRRSTCRSRAISLLSRRSPRRRPVSPRPALRTPRRGRRREARQTDGWWRAGSPPGPSSAAHHGVA